MKRILISGILVASIAIVLFQFVATGLSLAYFAPDAHYGETIKIQGNVSAIRNGSAALVFDVKNEWQTFTAFDPAKQYTAVQYGDRVEIVGTLVSSWDKHAGRTIPLVQIERLTMR